MFDFENLTLLQVAELANTIALELGEQAHAAFIARLFETYHSIR